MRCCDCKFRGDCKHQKNDLTAFASCSYQEERARLEVVNNTLTDYPCPMCGVAAKGGYACGD